MFWVACGRAESGIGWGRGGAGSGLGGGAGFSISDCSGVRDMYMESSDSFAEVWREALPELDFVDPLLLGGSGVFSVIVVIGGSGEDSASVGCLMSGDLVSRRGAGRLGDAPGRRGVDGRVGFLAAGGGTVIIAFSSATGVMGRATSTIGLI